MSSTHAYTALSADYADLAQPQRRRPAKQSSNSPSQFLKKWTRLHRAAEVLRELYARNVGLLLVLPSQLFFSLMNVAVKNLNSIDPPVSALELIVIRMSITYICSITYMLSTGVPDPFTGPKGVRLLLVVRGFVGFFGLFGIYFSLQYLSLSDATVISFLAPLFTTFSGAYFLGEKFSRREVFAGLFSLVGVVLIARPPFLFGSGDPEAPSAGDVTPEQRLIAVGVGLVGVFGATGAYTTLRAIGKRAHPLHSLVSFSLQCVFVATIGMIVTKTEFIIPTRLEWLAMLIMIGVFGFCAQVLLTMGLARETAGRGSMAVYTQVVFALILERIFFQAIPSALSVIGTLIIIACALFVALTKESSSNTNKGDKNTITLRNIEDESMEQGLLTRDSQDSELQKEGEDEDRGSRGKEGPERAFDSEPAKNSY